MIATLLLIYLTGSVARAHPPLRSCGLSLATTRDLPIYTRWLVEDGVLQPTLQLERLLEELSRVRARDITDDVKDLIGPAARVLPRVGDMIRLSQQLTQLGRGYEALSIRCARVADGLTTDGGAMEATISRSEDILTELDGYVRARPGRDTAWVRDQIARAFAKIEHFRTECHERLPPPRRGWFENLKRALWP